MLLELVAAGGIIFWLLMVIVLVSIVVSIEHNSFVCATAILLGTGFFIQLFTSFNMLGYLSSHAISNLLYFLSYLFIGGIWAICKWYLHCIKIASMYQIMRDHWLNANKKTLQNISYDDKKSMLASVKNRLPIKYGNQNRDIIYGWIIFWPFSALWTLTNEPIIYILKFITNQTMLIMQRISNRAFSSRFNELS